MYRIFNLHFILIFFIITDLIILKAELEKLGNIIFQDSHYLNKKQNKYTDLIQFSDYIVKYEKLDEAERAYEILFLKYTIEYITTQHNSDEATYYLSKLRGNFDQQEEDACLTLNMLKLKNNSYQQINELSSQTYRGYSQSFTFPQSQQNELEVFNNQIENNSMSRNEGLSINSNCYVPTVRMTDQTQGTQQYSNISYGVQQNQNISPYIPYIQNQIIQANTVNQRINQQLLGFRDQIYYTPRQVQTQTYFTNYQQQRNIPQVNLSKGISVEEAVQRISLQNDSQDTVQDNQFQTVQSQERNHYNQAEQSHAQGDFIKPDQSLQTKQTQSINFDQAYNNSAESSYNHNSGFKINLNNILNFKDQRTTIMIKNIPNKYTQKMLLSKINENHRDKYDFFYLPIDFKNKCNVGYAFINFVDSIFILKFFEELNGKRWECFNSEKVCEITYGRIQGKHQLIEHFDTSNLWFSSDRKVKPLILNVVQPNASFVKDYRKNLMVQFGSQSEIQTMKFQQKNGDHSNSRQYESQGQQNNSRQVTYYNRNY